MKFIRDEWEVMLWNFWGIDEYDFEFYFFLKGLQEEFLSLDVLIYDVMDNCYNELLLKVIDGCFYGIFNEYLFKFVLEIVGSYIEVEGYVEKLLFCFCCNYEILE